MRLTNSTTKIKCSKITLKLRNYFYSLTLNQTDAAKYLLITIDVQSKLQATPWCLEYPTLAKASLSNYQNLGGRGGKNNRNRQKF